MKKNKFIATTVKLLFACIIVHFGLKKHWFITIVSLYSLNLCASSSLDSVDCFLDRLFEDCFEYKG